LRVLHLFSNKKLTGPAEPAVNLCATLRRMGLDTSFACCTVSGHQAPAVANCAREKGLEPVTDFALTKHLSPMWNLHDLFKLPGFIEREKYDIVHAHLKNDHLVGGMAARKARRGVKVIRSAYNYEGLPRSLRGRYMLKYLTDALIVAAEGSKAAVIDRYGFPEDKIWVVPGAVDSARFDPSRKLHDMRRRFGLESSDFVIGLVARIQRHRRFDVLLKAMKMVSRANPCVKLLIVGRSSKMGRVAVEPVSRMGLEHCVKFAGYHRGDDYVATLKCFDAKIFLVPGSDGTCRAVREAMAMGKPIIAAKRGMLPEIVDHEVNGLVIEDTPEGIAEAILHLSGNRSETMKMGLEASKNARAMYGLEVQAVSVAKIYEDILRTSSASPVP